MDNIIKNWIGFQNPPNLQERKSKVLKEWQENGPLFPPCFIAMEDALLCSNPSTRVQSAWVDVLEWMLELHYSLQEPDEDNSSDSEQEIPPELVDGMEFESSIPKKEKDDIQKS